MTSNIFKAGLLKLGLAASLIWVSGGAVQAATVQLTASPQTVTLPDGQSVPMWGYTCGDAQATPVVSSGATCTAMNGAAQSAAAWQPPLITVPAGQPLTIQLVNMLSFTGGSVPTSIVIDGQVGGGLGTDRGTMPSPAHAALGTSWPGVAGTPDPTACLPGGNPGGAATFCPPSQLDRVRSFATEVTTADGTAGKSLVWSSLRPGTYLIHSGTQPSIQHPMGLYGVLVVTDSASTPTAPVAYQATFDKDVALLFSEIDPVQNREVSQVVNTGGFSDALVWDGQPGKCGDLTPGAPHTCYPPAVNYTPTYYLVNGMSFDRSNPGAAGITVPNTTATTGRLLLRMVNAGLRLHVPQVVNRTMTLVAEDGNKVPGSARLQASVAMAAGKTYDVTIQPAQNTTGATYVDATLAVYDRQLSLSTSNQRDGGMQTYIVIGKGALTGTASSSSTATTLTASDKAYFCSNGTPLTITDPAKGLLGGTTGANGLAMGSVLTGDISTSTLSVNGNGTFSYAPSGAAISANTCGGSFTFVVNAQMTKTATITQCDATLSALPPGCTLAAGPTASNIQFVSNVNARFSASTPGVLAGVSNPGGLTLTASGAGINADGSFLAAGPGAPADCDLFSGTLPAGTGCVKVPYTVTNVQGSTSSAVATVAFLPASGLIVNVWDAPSTGPGQTKAAINDYRWIIEEDQTFWIDPKCQINTTSTRTDSRGNPCPALPVESLGYNFHTAHMPVIAQGCVGDISCELGQTINNGTPTACDIGDGNCSLDGKKARKDDLNPSSVYLDPNKRYFISILPGDGINTTIGVAGTPDANGKPFNIATACGPYNASDPRWKPGNLGDAQGNNTALCGHAMGGSQIAASQKQVDIPLIQTPLPTAKISVFVFEDDNPLNGENDAGGGVDVIAPNEPGLAGFEIKLFDQAGGLGDATGQITYDMFNQPVSNSLANRVDPITTKNACAINVRGDGLVGMVTTCPKFEMDGASVALDASGQPILSPLAGQAVIANLYPGLYEIVATPAADRIARGEEWLQTNTLDGGKPHEAFIKSNEPGYFQEFGPGGFHVAIGFANPKIINARKGASGDGKGLVCSNQACTSSLKVSVTNNHMARTPDQRTFSSENYQHYSFTQCYVSIGPADAEDFAFEKCDADGTVTFTNIPDGTFKLTVFDQWNDIMLDGLVGTVSVNGNSSKIFPVTQWRTNLFTRTFIDQNGDGVSQDNEPGLALVNTNIHYRDGSVGFFNNTDLNGYAGFNEVFPFMNWLVVETSSTRYKPTGVHTVYDAGGPVDCSSQAVGGRCTNVARDLANTDVRVPLPSDLRMPGALYCDTADCLTGDAGTGLSTGTVFPPQPWGTTQGWQGLLGQNSFMEFGVKPFKPADPVANTPAENGGISGMVVYASTRPFDDPSLSLQLSWEPGVPRVKINLYSETVDDNGNQKLTLMDSTMSASWDDWAQGFRRDANGNLVMAADGKSFVPNMNCPGQTSDSPFFATLKNSKQWLDADKHAIAYQSQFKCYDGWSQLNQIQPAPYDGLYKFPSVLTVDANGKPASTNCVSCATNPDDGSPMLPPGKYVVEVILPPGYELVKEEDKNILMGDVYIAPVAQQFAGFGNVYILPDQAAINAAYNGNNPNGVNKTNNLGSVSFPRHEGDTGSVEAYWPCVGAEHIVPDLNSLFPGAGQAAPFAGAKRRLCDRKEVTVEDQGAALAKFFIFSSTHVAGHFTGTITNDFASEFDPFSPQFGEKFGPPNLPVGMRDFNGNEVARVYADQWGIYNGLYYSTYGVNPPNPTGYVPMMSIACMNDPGPIPMTNAAGLYVDATGATVASRYDAALVTDPSYNPAYSNFCYETPFMPGFTAYMDTPVIPTMAFADNYNLPDTEYPDATPVIKTVVGGGTSAVQGPWVFLGSPATRATAKITLSDVTVGDTVTSVKVGTTTLTGGTVTCNLTIGCTNLLGQTSRNIAMALALVNNINNRTGTTGYSATVPPFGTTITISAPAGTAANNTVIVVAQSGVTVSPSNAQFAGGTAGTPGTGPAITITSLGDKVVQNPNFSGPNSNAAPFNQKTITRHYGFGPRPSTCPTTGACPNVTVGGVPMNNVAAWSDTTISGDVVGTGVPACTVQQRNQGATQCGELVITAANGKQTIDAITVTIGGSAPWVVTESGVTAPAGKTVKDYTANFGRMGFSPIQTAIDSADPGDLILVQPGTYRENLIMWKPVRLQGVGASAVTINADAHPAGKMDQWRRQVNCVFGLTLDGTPNLGNTNYAGTDPTNAGYSCPDSMHQRVDRIPFEAIVGWDASGNGNLAQVLQEPTLMGAYEGAGITVLGRGARIPANSTDFWGMNATGGAGAFTDGSVYLTSSGNDCTTSTANDGRDYGTSNFLCNPSRIDGVTVMNSSQGGGGVFVHGWAHNLDIGNTRILGNHGTLAGAINLGNGETPDAFINDGVECGSALVGANAVMPCPPVTWNGYTPATNAAIAFQFNTKVRIHHNMLYNNASIGDALFSGTPAGAGAITVSAGSDGYEIDHNWIAGNMSTGDGGGLQHLGLSFQGKIDHNYVLFNQSTNPTLPTNGGGIVVEGANLDRTYIDPVTGAQTECGSVTDVDCPPGIGEGTGAGLVIDANLIIGNSAESGSGGGLRIQQINGSELVAFPGNSNQWYDVTVTNNIIANNVAGWDGGGVSVQDALKVSFVNNTVASNDTTASAGSLFKSLAAVDGASGAPGCTNDPTNPVVLNCPGGEAVNPHGPQPAGLVVMAHTANLLDAMAAATVTCPTGYGYSGGDCRKVSKPLLKNDLFWQNRAFSVNIVGLGSGTQSQQNVIALTPVVSQNVSGACGAGAIYQDIGLRTDDIAGGMLSTTGNKLTVSNSVYTSDFQNVISATANQSGGSNPLVAPYCNGARVPPENCAAQVGQISQASCKGYNTPAGASETTSLTQVFTFNGIQPTATVDEGHNWLNLVYGPLTLSKPNVANATNAEMMVASRAYGTAQGAYSIPVGSTAIGRGTTSGAPAADFYGNTRSGHNDAGAVQYTAASFASLSPATLSYGDVTVGATAQLTLTLTAGSASLNGMSVSVSGASFTRPSGPAGGNCNGTVLAGNSCTIIVSFTPTATGVATGQVAVTGSSTVVGSAVPLSGNGVQIDLSVVPNTMLQFGDVYVGSPSAAQMVTLTNTSSGTSARALSGISFAFNGPFSRSTTAAGTCDASGAISLALNASCTIGVVFTPTVGMPVLGALKFSAATPMAIDGASLQLSGNGLLPTIAPASLNFGSVPVGTAVVQTLTFSVASNINSTSLPTLGISVTGGVYTRASGAAGGTCGTSAASATSCTVGIQFLPTAVGQPSSQPGGQVTITVNGNAIVAPVPLSGIGIAATHTASVAPTSLAFGSQSLGTVSATQNLTVANTGNSALGGITINGISGGFSRVTTGTFPANAPNCGTTLAVGASCTVAIHFAPTAGGSANATVTVGGSGSTAPAPVSASLTGTGVVPSLRFSSETGSATLDTNAMTLNFGNRSGTTSSTLTLTVGTAPVTIGAASVTGGAYSLGANSCTGPKAANTSCTIVVNFNGAGNNLKTGTLSVPFTGGTGSPLVLSLSGS